MKKLITAAAIASLITGCATPPNQLPTKNVSTLPFEQYNCQQIEMEYERLRGEKEELHGTLQTLADHDALQVAGGLVLLWPMLLFVEGGDGVEAANYSETKGEIEALQKVAIAKQCPVGQRIKEEQAPKAEAKPKGNARCGMYQTCKQIEE